VSDKMTEQDVPPLSPSPVSRLLAWGLLILGTLGGFYGGEVLGGELWSRMRPHEGPGWGEGLGWMAIGGALGGALGGLLGYALGLWLGKRK
jgi:hypothetical protein